MSCARGCCKSVTEHYKSLSMQTRISATTLTERQWAKDHAAYRTLRSQGYQPPSPDGAAVLAATAQTDSDIEVGKVMGKEFDKVRKELG